MAEIITVPANSAAVEKKDGQMVEINGELQKITGVKTVSGGVYHCKAVVLCTGTYLRARCLTGEMITYTGPNGLMAANHLTDSLKAHGIEMFRFKTGTPARVDKRSLDFSKMQEQKGDERVVPFSFTTNPEDVQIDQVSCWLTYTNPKTHEIIRANLDRSPIYAGIIEGTGPRISSVKNVPVFRGNRSRALKNWKRKRFRKTLTMMMYRVCVLRHVRN